MFKLFSNFIALFTKKNDLVNYHYGDIIWCEVKEYADYNFKGKHQIRPFIFVGYKNNKIYGYTLTHNKPLKKTLNYNVTINDEEGYIILACLFCLPKKSYKGFMGNLSDKDASNIAKIVYNMQDDEDFSLGIKSKLNISENDIVLFQDKNYYVYSLDNNQATLYSFGKTKDDIAIKTSDKGLIYFSSKAVFAKVNMLEYVDTFKDLLYLEFKQKKKELEIKNKPKDNFKLKIGDVYKSKNGTFVICAIEENRIKVLKMYNPESGYKYTTKENRSVTGHVNEFQLKILISKADMYDKFLA